MKRTITIALYAAASILAAGSAVAQRPQQGHYQTIQYSAPPAPVMTVCDVNGVDYQVDFSYRIWAINGYGGWLVIGRIVPTPVGPIAIRNDGMRFSAVCE